MDPSEIANLRPFHPYRELRNRLSELFLAALADPGRAASVFWLHTYCRLAQPQGSAVSLPALAEAVGREVTDYPWADRRESLKALLADFDLLQLRHRDRQEVYRGAAALDGLSWSAGDTIELYPEFRDYSAYAAQRAEKFWAVIGHLMERPECGKAGVEGAVARGVLVFNAGLFFEYHELLEDHWRAEIGDRKRFLQGLIQVAVGLHHWENGNYNGAVILLREGAERLAVGRPHMLGLDVETFYRDVQAVHAALESLGCERARDLTRALIPKQKTVLRTEC